MGLLPLLEADLSFADLGDRVSTTARRDEIPGTDDNERGNDKKKDYAKENALVATDGFKHGDAPLCAAKVLAEWTGLEPATPGVTGRYSNQLNYHSAWSCFGPLAQVKCNQTWRPYGDSNPGTHRERVMS